MRKNRIIYSNNGSLSDWTVDINKYRTGSKTFSFVASEDYLYIGSISPFNSLYAKLSTPSVASSTMSVSYWSGSQWRSVVELIDETNGFTESGFISFVPDRDHAWVDSDTSGDQTVTGLGDLTIYDKYWLRISFDNDLTTSSVINWVGQKFSDDNDLRSEYPELVSSNVLTSFEAGKTDWEEQHVAAAELIVDDLIRKSVIKSGGQILDNDSYKRASVSKVAELIFISFGDDYKDQALAAKNEYESRIDKTIYDVDENEDGELDDYEMTQEQGFLSR